MSNYEEAVLRLAEAVQHHESVQSFQKVEQKLKSYPELKHLVHKMKAHQQDAVLFKKIDKQKAEHEADKQALQIQKDLLELPIVQDYRSKMQDASDLIQYVTKRIEDRINEELVNGK